VFILLATVCGLGKFMSFENLVVEKVVLHEVFKRRHDGALVAPRYARQLVALPPDAMASFTERVIDAVGDASQSMELEIAEHGPDSAQWASPLY
jgi:hypothetical protein